MSASHTMGWLLGTRFFVHSPFHRRRCHNYHFHRRRCHVALLSSQLQQQHISTQPSPQPQKEMPFIAEYLVSTFGFSPDRAVKLSANSNVGRIKSPDRPDTVITFLRDTGLSDSQIKAAISLHPPLLAYNVDNTLKPNAREFVENGLSEKLLVELIRYCPGVLIKKTALSGLLFWRDFVGEGDEALLKIFRRNNTLIFSDIDKHIVPKINLLKEYGLSNQDIVQLLGYGFRFMSLGLDSLRQTIELIEELGLTRGSRMFLCGIKAVGSLRKDKIHKKVEVYETTYGWSKEDVSSSFRKFPFLLQFSEEKIKSNMDFLIKKAKFAPRSIASTPQLLGYSLEKRLVPRHNVLSILTAKGLKINCSLSTVWNISEKRFLEKYVKPYKEDIPELAEAYFAASGGNISV